MPLFNLDCLQSSFSLKIRLVLISDSAIANHDVMLQWGIRTRREKTDCGLFCCKQTLRQPRNGEADWSVLQLLTDHWLVCGGDASDKDSHASQLTTSNYAPSGNRLLTTTLKDILQKETAVNFLKGKEFKAILPDLKGKFFQLFMFYL